MEPITWTIVAVIFAVAMVGVNAGNCAYYEYQRRKKESIGPEPCPCPCRNKGVESSEF
jgi:hypothetical protein